MPESKAKRHRTEADAAGEQSQLSQGLPQAGQILCAVAIGEQGLHAHADPHLHHGD